MVFDHLIRYFILGGNPVWSWECHGLEPCTLPPERGLRCPGSRWGMRLPDDPIAFGHHNLLTCLLPVPGGKRDVPKPFAAQDGFPTFCGQSGTAWDTQLRIFIGPPSREQPKSQVCEEACTCDLV